VNGRDPHTAVKSEAVSKISRDAIEAAIARLQWTKDDVRYSLHVNPTGFTSAGIQKVDFLSFLGFERCDRCTFTNFQRCFVKWVPEDFHLDRFLKAFEVAFAHLEKADSALEACGVFLPQPEGWGFYNGRPSLRRDRRPRMLHGDGHTGLKTQDFKHSEDDTFLFSFTFIETSNEKGFVTHYRPKHPPLSSELSSVFAYFDFQQFRDCPQFDFETCFYRAVPFESGGGHVFDSNAGFAHGQFDAHAGRFSTGIQELLASNENVEAFGLSFLPIGKPRDRLAADINQMIIRPEKPAVNAIVTNAIPSNFDVAISVAGADKTYASKLADLVRAAGYSVFYYEFFPEYLWGKNLPNTFDEIFRKRSRYCVIFVSKEYHDRVWTNHELRSAQARAVQEKGKEYILPVRLDDTELEGLLPTIGYVPIDMGIDKIGELLIKKLQP